MVSRRWWWTTLFVILGIGISIRLGIWQLDRNAERRLIVRQIQALWELPSLNLNQLPITDDLEKMEFRHVHVIGKYDFEHQVVLRNQVWTQSWGDESGYALLTPLILSDGQAIMIERGWIPSQYDSPASWEQFNEPGTVTVEGIIRLPMVKGEMGGGKPDPTLAPGETRLEHWNYVNLLRLQQQMPYPLLDVYIQQAPGSNPEKLPYRWLSQPELNPGAHIGFALMWFFYAGLLFFGYPRWLQKQKTNAINRDKES